MREMRTRSPRWFTPISKSVFDVLFRRKSQSRKMGDPETACEPGTFGPKGSASLCPWRRDEFPGTDVGVCSGRWNCYRRRRTIHFGFATNPGYPARDGKTDIGPPGVSKR